MFLALVCLLAAAPAGAASGGEPELTPSKATETIAEQRIKSAFIYNFIKFTTWPKQSFETRQTPIRIGVVGQTTLAKILADTLKGKIVAGRSLEVVLVSDPSQLEQLHVLYFPRKLDPKLEPELIASLRERPVMTVGHSDGFAKRGGLINLFIKNKKFSFEINVDALKRSGLSISSQLLKLATIVKEEK